MADEPQLRASDHDREQTAAAIREHYAAGRLDSGEFEERVHAAYSARTQGELSALSADLPALPPKPPKPPTTMELARQTFNTSVLVRNASAGGGAFLVCTAIWALTGADGDDFWPKWVLILTLVTIVRGIRRGARGPGARGPGPDRGGGDRPGHGHHYSYRYEHRYGDPPEAHKHE
ncbi:MAG: DUF1707 SHOCT-like domain-containing protein [Solirubrobacteraceae bacterium]